MTHIQCLQRDVQFYMLLMPFRGHRFLLLQSRLQSLERSVGCAAGQLSCRPFGSRGLTNHTALLPCLLSFHLLPEVVISPTFDLLSPPHLLSAGMRWRRSAAAG